MIEYVQEKELPIDPQHFFDYYDAGDWKDREGNKVKSWKQKAISWARRDRQDSSPSQSVPITAEERQQEEEHWAEEREKAREEHYRRKRERGDLIGV